MIAVYGRWYASQAEAHPQAPEAVATDVPRRRHTVGGDEVDAALSRLRGTERAADNGVAGARAGRPRLAALTSTPLKSSGGDDSPPSLVWAYHIGMTAPAPDAFHVMAKPTGARCNLHCDYCFFLEKEDLYPGSDFRMSDEVMESYIAQTIEAQRVPQVTIAWQGGEPTLMGLDFFRRARAAEAAHLPAGMTVERTIQTNGVLLDDEWADVPRRRTTTSWG